MRPVDEQLLHGPHVAGGEAPVVAAHGGQMRHRVAAHASGVVHVGIDVAQCEGARRGKDRPPAVQAGVARAGNRPPAAWAPVDEDHVVEPVDRLEAHQQRRNSRAARASRRQRAPPRGSGPYRVRPRRGRCAESRRRFRRCRAARSATPARPPACASASTSARSARGEAIPRRRIADRGERGAQRLRRGGNHRPHPRPRVIAAGPR